MGRQVGLHLLSDDLKSLLSFVQRHDPVDITVRDSDCAEVESVPNPLTERRIMTLWNRNLLRTLERTLIRRPGGKDYYSVDRALPTIELDSSQPSRWQGRAALLQGRIYGPLLNQSPAYASWFNTIARWIRSRGSKDPGGFDHVYVGPATMSWFLEGGVLLPTFDPPETPEWIRFFAEQDAARARLGGAGSPVP